MIQYIFFHIFIALKQLDVYYIYFGFGLVNNLSFFIQIVLSFILE
jgi:hypothetical protein